MRKKSSDHKKLLKRVPPEAQIVGRNLRNLRQYAGLSQEAVGRILGVTFQQVQKYEHGKNRFPLERLHRLKIFYDVPYAVFFEGLCDDESTSTSRGNAEISGALSQLEGLKDQKKKQKIFQILNILLE